MRVYGYARRSRHDDDSSSIAKQEQIIRDYCARHGYELVGIGVDKSASATKTRLDRPGLTEAREAVAHGLADAILCWRLDRIARSVVDFGKILDEGAQVISATEPLDTTSPMGRAMVEIIQVFAALESAVTGERMKATKAFLKSSRRWTGGPRPYGYRPVKAADGVGKILRVDEAEADTVRRIFSAILDGVPLNGIARALVAEGVPTSTGVEWTQASVVNLARAFHVSGYLTESAKHDRAGKPVGRDRKPVLDEAGEPVVAWTPLVGPLTAEAVRAKISREALDEARSEATKAGRAAPKRLLEGLALCTCGKPLIRRNRSGVLFYGCRGVAGGGHIMAEAEKVEEEATRQFLARFSGSEVVETVRNVNVSEALSDVLAALNAASARVTKTAASDLPALFARIAELTAEKERLEVSESKVETRRTRSSYGDAWEAWSTEERREHLLAVGVSVQIVPARRRGFWDAGRVRLVSDSDYLVGQTA